MTKLSVNVNKLATLRNSRGKNNPDVLKTALEIISYGAQGITVHPRPDGRHIRKEDVYQLAEAIQVEFNIEGYPDKNFLDLVKEVHPTQCTMVPDPPHVLTSNAGWQIKKNVHFLQDVIADLQRSGIRTSLFVDPHKLSEKEIELLKVTGTNRVELYTEVYADTYGKKDAVNTLTIYKRAAEAINKLGIDLNAGHDLNLLNLKHFIAAIPTIKEVSIGHALICDALNLGMKETISRYLACLQ
ncbi:MAG: pyridoxine 5'-phosphate synthase [Gammaproteobacteria bacterium RIFCSPHIGHO2_12_FULL_42_10]|nr:MAG: pyridoxine 5'-phosphate synthase [Gammaproteobacteria bacterium RIFCSPHIGHO2_12_FULL_42_10]